MKRQLFFIILILLLALMVVALVGAQTTPEPTATPPTATPMYSYVIAESIFVRSGPGEEYAAIGHLKEGAILQPVNRDESGEWVLIKHLGGFGWIHVTLASWYENLDNLPVLYPYALTPTIEPGSETATPFFPTETPGGNFVRVDASSAYVRAGPGRTYLRIGQLFPAEQVEPVGRNKSWGWIMIRFGDGFGWVAYDLVAWQSDLENLPVLSEDDLTPTVTFTPSVTATDTITPTATYTASVTATNTPTPTVTLTPTVTSTATPTATNTMVPSYTPTYTATVIPSATFTATATWTQTPSVTSTSIPTLPHTATWTATNTDIPTATMTDTPVPPTSTMTEVVVAVVPTDTSLPPTVTDTPVPPSETPTATWTQTPSATSTYTVTPSETPTPSETATSTATMTLTHTLTVSATYTLTDTVIPATDTPEPPTVTATTEPTEIIAVIASEIPSLTPTLVPETEGTDGGGLPLEAIFGGGGLLVVLVYVGLYLRGAAAAERYADGFVVKRCPVCGRGHLTVDTRLDRILGIPRARRIVRCDVCRSVLRETGRRRWRYAVDRIENPTLFGRFNGREVDENTLQSLIEQPPSVPRPATPPQFVDDDQ